MMPSPTNKRTKQTGPEQVQVYLDNLEPSLKQMMTELRAILFAANDQLTEHIKWNAPSFCLHGDDRITFQVPGKGFVRLVFHRGAKVKEPPAHGRLFEDTTGLLEWAANDRAMAVFHNMDDVEQKREKLKETAAKWLEVTAP